MFRLDVLQNQWLIATLAGGAAILFCVILLFLALWRPREDPAAPAEGTAQRPSVLEWLRSFMPWLLILMALATAAFVIVYAVGAMRRPPNW